MLNQLIESKGHARENARKNGFLAVTFGVLAAVLLGGWTYSLFAKSYGVGGSDLEVSSLVAPVTLESDTPPERPVRPERNVSRTPQKVVLEELYEDLWRSGVPEANPGKANVVSARQYGLDNVVKGSRTYIPEGAGRSNGGNDNGCGLCEDNETRRTPVKDGIDDLQVKPKATPSDTPHQKREISLGPINSRATYLPRPAYSQAAIAVKASGQVQVQVSIDETGRVTSAAVIAGHPMLRQASLEAARNSKFTPTILGGRPMKVTGVIIYNFLPR